jgi:D-serine deaminase-like pyridoxal phosphate-dependent protein|nr:alanine racemase [Kofleriaceae bacterium]
MTPRDDYARFKHALAGRRLPCAVVDGDAFERNVDRLVAPIERAGKRLRIATKSLRCPALVRRVAERARAAYGGVMTYTAAESAWWIEHGERDVLLAYPTLQRADLDDLARANRVAGATCAVVVDDVAQVDAIATAARAARAVVPVVVDLDVSWRPLGGALHVGVRRSPVHDAPAAVALAAAIAASDGVRFHGVMAYDAQIAGVTDAGPFQRWQNGARRAIKHRSRGAVERARAEVARDLRDSGWPPAIFNGGGTGSLAWSAADPTLTEVTVGSGFLGPHLFDYYADVEVEAAAYFALQVVRRPAPRVVTCHGGGYIASGAAGDDRLPRPALPAGCSLLPLEGAGEVQTPLALADGVELALGDPVLFRHAKAGELAEHFESYAIVRGDRVVEEVPTWRGMGTCFLG